MQTRFIVPQFIDAEDRIWGPITVRQFVIVIVGALFIFISFRLSDFALFLTQTVIIVLLVVLFAFARINGAPFHMFLLNLTQTLKRPKLRVWKKEYIKIADFKNKGEGIKIEPFVPKALVASRKLSELSLIIDTGGTYRGEQEANILNNLPSKQIIKK
jgi:hypothetical protein